MYQVGDSNYSLQQGVLIFPMNIFQDEVGYAKYACRGKKKYNMQNLATQVNYGKTRGRVWGLLLYVITYRAQ